MDNIADAEKANGANKGASITEGEAPSVDSGSQEFVVIDSAVERKLVRKLDFCLLPWMALVSSPSCSCE